MPQEVIQLLLRNRAWIPLVLATFISITSLKLRCGHMSQDIKMHFILNLFLDFCFTLHDTGQNYQSTQRTLNGDVR